MKTTMIARCVFAGAAIFAAAGLIGCGAEGGAPAEQTGAASEALGIANLATAQTGVAPNKVDYKVQYPGYITANSNADIILFGGYNESGTARATVMKYNKAGDTWTQLTDLGTARGEPSVTLISGTKYLVLGGKSSGIATANNELDTAEIYDIASSGSTVAVTDTLSSKRVHHEVTPCGSKLLVSAGLTTNGSTESRTGALEVFTFNSGTPANSTFDLLVDDTPSTPRTIELQTPRQFHAAFAYSSNTKINIVGGDGTGTSALNAPELLTVSSSCVADKNTIQAFGPGNTKFAPATGPDLPDNGAGSPLTRARGVLAPIAHTVTGHGATVYDVAYMAGNDSSNAAALKVFSFDTGTATWVEDTGMVLGAGRGRLRPALAINTTDSFALVGGNPANSNVAETSTNKTDVWSTSWATGTSLITERNGGAAAYINSTFIAAGGKDITNSAYPVKPE